MDSLITVAQLGCGYWGPNLLRNFHAQPACRVKWVAEQSNARRGYVSENFPGIGVSEDWQSVVGDPEVDAVIIATPASTHYELAFAALEAGKHAFVEKPLAMCTSEAERLGRLARAMNRTLMVGHTFLYNAAVRYTKKLVEDGELGQVYYIYTQRLNLGQVRSDVNAWWNLAPHDVAILLYLMDGELPQEVSARGVDYIQPGIEDVVFATLTWSNRVSAHIHVSWLDPGKARSVTLVGSRKMVICDDMSDDKILLVDKGVDRVPHAGERMDYDQPSHYKLVHRAGDVFIPKIEVQEPLKMEAAHFLECIRTGKTPLTGPDHARDVIQVLEAVERSLKSGGRSVEIGDLAGAR